MFGIILDSIKNNKLALTVSGVTLGYSKTKPVDISFDEFIAKWLPSKFSCST